MIRINPNATYGRYKRSDIFPDIGQNPILRELFKTASELKEVLAETAVIISDGPSYMRVDNVDGSIFFKLFPIGTFIDFSAPTPANISD